MQKKEKKTFIIFDGNALIHSSYHISKKIRGVSNFTTYFFLRSLICSLKSIKYCQKILFFFDGERSKIDGYRRKILPEYKMNRIKLSDDFIKEMILIKDLLKEIKIIFFQISENEADDLIASLVLSEIFKSEFNFIIWTKDKDFFQLINKDVSIFKRLTKGKAEIYKEKDFLEEYKFQPKNFVDYLSLIGDSSDNIDGIKGIGKITAKKLIIDYGNIENIYENEKKITGKIKDILFSRNKEKIKIKLEKNKKLIKLNSNLLDEHILSEIKKINNFEWNNLVRYCQKKKFNSILELIEKK